MATKERCRAISVAPSSMKACSKTRKLTSKILKEAFAQQREIKNEKHAEEFPMSTVFSQAVYYGSEEDFTDDVDELSEYPNQLDYQDVTNEEEDKLLDALFNKDGASIAKRLTDAITCTKEEELKDKEDDATETSLMSKSKAIEFFQSLGKFMCVYTQGKMPKALTHVPRRENWDSLLMLTQPENWSPYAIYKLTNMFASSGEKAARFYQFFLLPLVREDIRKHKKLHFCLYQSLKKALFKPQGFFSGILIPLCKSGTCTLSEAVIIASIMEKVSIPEKFSSAALVCLAGMTFRGTTSYFIKVILDKKYALAYGAVDAVTAYFLRFHNEATVLPVIWHQTLLALVQRYKHELRCEDKKSLRSLVDKQHHKLITPEIVRELDNSRNRGEKLSNSSSASSTIIKPIKEDMFDMPEVPMEED